jgi:hypothetical protein
MLQMPWPPLQQPQHRESSCLLAVLKNTSSCLLGVSKNKIGCVMIAKITTQFAHSNYCTVRPVCYQMPASLWEVPQWCLRC